MDFELGGVRVPVESGVEFNQSYFWVVPRTYNRMMSGKLVPSQGSWKKFGTKISAIGWIASGLDALDYNSPMLLKCAMPHTISSASNIITLPVGHRTDKNVRGFANTVGGRIQEVSVDIVGDVVTLGVLAGAASYSVNFYPEFTVYAKEPETTPSANDATFQWSLEAEQE